MDETEHQKDLLEFCKYMSKFLGALAVWPLKGDSTQQIHWLRIIHFYFIFILCVLSLQVSCLIQVIIHITDLSEVIKVFFIFATSISVFAKYVSIKRYNHLYQLWLDMIKMSTFRPSNPKEKELFQQSIRLANIVRNSYIACSLIALTNVIAYRKNELPLSIYMPFNADNDWTYLLLYLYQCIAASICCFTNIGFDSYVTSASIHLKGQLDILCDRLESLHKDDLQQRNIVDKLKDTIKYYDEILKLARIIEHLITIPISIQIACSVLVLVANLYVLVFESDDYSKIMKVVTYQICMLMQIYLLCYYPGEVTTRSELTSYALYNSNWFKWTKQERKFMLLLLYRYDVPIKFRSINPTYAFNVAAFSSIINSSYSYFALLKRFKN